MASIASGISVAAGHHHVDGRFQAGGQDNFRSLLLMPDQ
jgi:hypothetical protein